MKFKHILLALVAFCCASQTAMAQDNKNEVDVTVFESVLSTAKWANFDYLKLLDAAKKGDHKATLKLLEFSGTVDGVAELDHSVTLLELIASGGDITFAGAVNMASPKLQAVLLQRLQLAQGRTKKLELQKPISEWAPTTWEVLNGRLFDPKVKPGEEKSCMDKVPQPKKPLSPVTDDFGIPVESAAPANEATPSDKPKGKQ